MKNVLISDLINSLMPLSQGLLRASYIFKELNETELFDWCSKEMNGYDDRENVPEYRKFQGVLNTDIMNGYTYTQNFKIPLNENDENLKKISTIHNGQSISAIESLIDSSNPTFATLVPADNYWVAQKYIQGNIQNLRVLVHKAAFEHIITSVKKELIDKLYDLSKKYGNLNKYDIGKKKMKRNQPNITNNNVTFGDNTKISNSQVGNTNTKTEGSSKKFFEKHPVLSAIVAALIVAIIVATRFWKEIIIFLGK